ncbi:MAG: hypothetical protein ACYCT7_08965 [bacterium]
MNSRQAMILDTPALISPINEPGAIELYNFIRRKEKKINTSLR